MINLDLIIDDLMKRKRSVACNGKNGLLAILSSLGFKSSQGLANHYIFTHFRLSEINSEFTTFSIDCGHYPKRPMKFPYVVKTTTLLKKYQTELEQINKD